MPLTTEPQIIAGELPAAEFSKATGTLEAIGTLHSTFYNNGTPGAASAPVPGPSGAALTSYAGQFLVPAPIAGREVALTGFSVQGSVIGTAILADRLWHNSGINTALTTAQTINSAAWPARCWDYALNGWDTDGDGINVAAEVSQATTNAAVVVLTVSYTNSAGVSGRAGTITMPATAQLGTFVPMVMQAGDRGVRSIQSITQAAAIGGTYHLVAYRRICSARCLIANLPGQAAERRIKAPLADNSVPFLVWLPTATTALTIAGEITYSQG